MLYRNIDIILLPVRSTSKKEVRGRRVTSGSNSIKKLETGFVGKVLTKRRELKVWKSDRWLEGSETLDNHVNGSTSFIVYELQWVEVRFEETLKKR